MDDRILVMNEFQLLCERLNSLRERLISIDEFRSWVSASNKLLSKTMSRGLLLKIRRGNVEKVMSVAVDMLPSCIICKQIFKQGDFESRSEYNICSIYVNNALRSEFLINLSFPFTLNPQTWCGFPVWRS